MFWLSQGVGMHSRAFDDHPDRVVLVAAVPPAGQANTAALAAFLGNALPSATVPDAASRFRLLGVVAQGQGGAALLALDDQPAKVYRASSRLDENTVLQAVGLRHVVLGSGEPGEPGKRLEMPGRDELDASDSGSGPLPE